MRILPKSFYNKNTLQVAQDLLGCFLVRKNPRPRPLPRSSRRGRGESTLRCKIVEVEAYNGPRDLASHASRGRTKRNSVMFGGPGKIYVYFTYGMHYMLNIVTEEKDYPAAVLIRAISCNIKHKTHNKAKNKSLLTNGPAKLTKALGVDKSFNSLPIYVKKYGLWIESRIKDEKPKIVKTKRIGVDYAGRYKDEKWRFYIRGNEFISKK
ncbi:MAG: DNA-3-methyladenine glycosylase [Patescibacteria group bacterium]|nr:DNA-3-methyladenine glycosylase [Patescibacteria group bacterium]